MSEISHPNPDMPVDYRGEAGRLFGIAFGSAILTLLTLGIYRFWMKAKLRRYYWASIQPGGIPLEYTGTGLEKLLGFLIAVVILAVYLGIFNLGLTFVGLAFFEGNPVALNLSFLAVVPLIYYARYRSRAYILSRTRWRGLRFGLEPDAWRYTLSAIGHTLITIVTLGVLFPRQRFKMEKFVTDRTWYGSLRMRQDGEWTMNLKPWLLVIAILVLTFAAYVALIIKVTMAPQTEFSGVAGSLFFMVFAGYLLVGFAYVYFSVVSFRNMANHKILGKSIRFTSKIRTGTVTGIYVLGGLGIGIATGIIFSIVMGAAGLVIYGLDLPLQEFGRANVQNLSTAAQWTAFGILGAGYLVVLLLAGVLAQVFIFQPILRHYATELVVHNLAELETAAQRAHDSSVDAGGFADALDVGAAI